MSWWQTVLVAGAAGLGGGAGVVIGIALIRELRRYARNDDPGGQ